MLAALAGAGLLRYSNGLTLNPLRLPNELKLLAGAVLLAFLLGKTPPEGAPKLPAWKARRIADELEAEKLAPA